MASKTTQASSRFIAVSSGNHDGGRTRHIVVVTGGIEDQRVRLRLAEAVGCFGADHLHTPHSRSEAVCPRPESKAAGIIAQGRFAPACTVVRRNGDRANDVTAIPPNATDCDGFTGARTRAY